MLARIDPPLPLYIPGKGKGLAHFLIDYGIEHNLFWVVFMDETGECWTFENPVIRIQKNTTLGRTLKMAEKWIAKATKNKGALHRKLGVAEGKKIPAKKLAIAAKSKSPKVRKEVVLAKNLSKLRKRK